MHNNETYTIGQMARTAQVAASAIRFYERRGLLFPEARTAANYRVYGPQALDRLGFIRVAQANGFTLEDIAQLLRFRDGKTPACQEVQHLIEKRLTDLTMRTAQLNRLQKSLRLWLNECRRNQPSGRCELIDELGVARSRPRRSRVVPRRRKKSQLSRKP